MRWAGHLGFRDAKLHVSYEHSRMGRVTTDIVVSEVKLEHSGSKKPELNSIPVYKHQKRVSSVDLFTMHASGVFYHIACEKNNVFKYVDACGEV